ncbi:FISUMP domain-containing protein [uncultured Fibrobacter sp.]|uniref:FISUMP domain-containing protein n=1 Tax=uncultured Fibrobacter sp. TaxID=261512 RepID=UPI0025EC2C19|nr:FISUMP domain-containing protein [uncultured Fibrobacter sp.]
MKRLIKKTLLFTIPLVFSACIFDSDEEDVEPWDAEAVCPAEGTNSYGMPNRGTFTDERDGEVYRYTTIGDQVWMAENLRYDAPYSTCCNDTNFIRQYCELIEHNCGTEACCRESMCNLFGRYYSIVENGKEMGLIDEMLADTICPKGWHLPTKDEWKKFNETLKTNGETEVVIANRIKHSDSAYFSLSNVMLPGTDDCAMGIMPSGYLYEGGKAKTIGASFLSTTQKNSDFIYSYKVGSGISISSHYYRNSIRCIKDSINPEL